MQHNSYESAAALSAVDGVDRVVGVFDGHNAWPDYDNYLFKGIDLTRNKVALDFGCGPGRNMVKYRDWFKRIDGCDIAQSNLDNARRWVTQNNAKHGNLYHINGVDLRGIASEVYDVVFSTICLQHICVHEIRYNLMAEFLRVLKPGGTFCAQMSLDAIPDPRFHDYFANNYQATATNGYADVSIADPSQLGSDLNAIGFSSSSFEYDIRPVGPGDTHANWIFFRVTKHFDIAV